MTSDDVSLKKSEDSECVAVVKKKVVTWFEKAGKAETPGYLTNPS